MKRTLNIVTLVMFAFLSITTVSCLKDKGFDDGTYGSITGRTEGQEFVSIPRASRPDGVNTMGIEAKAGVQAVKLFALSYDAVDPPAQDFTAKLVLNNAIVTAYDIKDTNIVITPLPTANYTIPSYDVQFRAGRRISDSLIMNINTTGLSPDLKYGIGFTLESTSKPGVQIPSNLKNVILIFTIKNKYDGIYELRSHMLHPPDRAAAWTRTPYTYPYDIYLVTTGPKTVEWINTAFAGNEGYHPLMTPGVSGFGATRPLFTFDDNDKLISVTNAYPNPPNGRQFEINNASAWNFNGVDVPINNHYDPATKTIYAAFYMTQPGFAPIPIFDTLKFIKARP